MNTLCACGCGEPLDAVKHPEFRKTSQGFKPGHWARLHPPKPYQPVPDDDVPSGLCECGCGKPTKIATKTLRNRRHFKDCPMPYCHGHGGRSHGADHHLFTGIRHHGSGYVYEYAPDHPNAVTFKTTAGYVAQHRLVWEQANGRLLRDNEVVHHINGVRDDNRPENLVALTNSEHCGLHTEEHQAGHSEESRQKISAAMKRVWAERKARS
jgi:hypothetical protein